MAFTVDRSVDETTGLHAVTVKVSLSFTETNALFLSGDTIISWPDAEILGASEPENAGATPASEAALVRTGMFISELARLAPGLKIGYRQETEAERAGQVMRLQLLRAGMKEET